jgi:hypothetical protein
MTDITQDIKRLEQWFAERPVWVSPFDDEDDRATYESDERRWRHGFSDRCDPDRIARILAALKEAQADTLEQAKIVGMGGERELALMAKVERANARLAQAVELLTDARQASDYLGRLGVCERIDAFLAGVGK